MDKKEFSLGNGNNLEIKCSTIVTLNQSLIVINQGETLSLDVTINADFGTIPEKYHEIFLNVLSSKYYGRAVFGDNPFSQSLSNSKKRWWQFWKSN
jgi:hypothetical protein